jgi:hypothetical protein
MAAYFTRSGGAYLPPLTPTIVPVKSVTSGNYNIQLTDYYIGCNGTGITVTLPLGSTVPTGKVYFIKDESGLISGNSSYRITLNVSDANTIDGQSTLTIVTSYTAITVLWTGSFWSII